MLDKEGFDLWAGGYDRAVGLSDEDGSYPFAGYRQVLGRIYDAVRRLEGKRVLDLGCGTGTLAGKLYRDGYAVTAVDFSGEMLRRAAEKMPSARLVQADFSDGLPEELDGERFDAIVCTYAIHHLTDEQKLRLLTSLQKRLTPGGAVFIGDVAFPTRRELLRCREQSGEAWDDEELYLVAEELLPRLPGAAFEPVSHCAGILTLPALEKGGDA
ncbi:MAG: class I SAM-dependent methyltransferase [Oscillospiraceae bacterium]|nr:class I SAM-dependent methyltransferase [Oscillospiraceae bacterium]